MVCAFYLPGFMPPKVLFLLPYSLRRAPSQRFRVELFLPALQRAGIQYHLEPFMNERTWKILYQPGAYLQKALGVIRGIFRRLYCVVFIAPRYTHVFIHREAAPIGPPVFEWILARVLRKKIIYDFDDAIWIPKTTRENKLISGVKSFGKIRAICSWANSVVVGNQFLASWAGQWNKRVSVIPTCVDVVNMHNKLRCQESRVVTVGWTGSHSTMEYLDFLVPVLEKLANQFDGSTGVQVNFVIISNKPPAFQLSRMEYLPWSEASEIKDLMRLNIGLMPLEQDAWSNGKCGFKLIQYLALGIPAVASPVGVNKNIIENGVNGFLCVTEQEWFESLQKMIVDASLRKSMGEKGRKKIEAQYSIQCQEANFLRLFN